MHANVTSSLLFQPLEAGSLEFDQLGGWNQGTTGSLWLGSGSDSDPKQATIHLTLSPDLKLGVHAKKHKFNWTQKYF